MTTRITKEQAEKLRDGITPGPWHMGQESTDPEWWIVTLSGGMVVANVNAHKCQEANASAVAALPDLLATVITLHDEKDAIAARVAELEAQQEAMVAAAYEAAAQINLNRTGREWVNNSLWANMAMSFAASIRSLTPDDARNHLAKLLRDERNKARREDAAIVTGMRDAYVSEFGSYDPSTGMTDFSLSGEEYVSTLDDTEEAILATIEKDEANGQP